MSLTRTQINTQFGKVNFDLFFNEDGLIGRWDRKKFRVLSNTGAFGRGVMRRLIKKGGKRGKPAKQGKPPKYWTRGFGSLKDGIFFQADVNVRGGGVVIGPNKLKTKVTPNGGYVSSAQVLNEGGTGTITVKRFNKPSKTGKVRPPRETTHRTQWQGNNFTQPAFQPTKKRLEENLEKYQL